MRSLIIMSIAFVVMAGSAYAGGSYIYHWTDTNGINHWGNTSESAAMAADWREAIKYSRAEAEYYNRRVQRWQRQWNIEADRALKAREIDAGIYKVKIRAATDLAIAKIKALAQYASSTNRTFAPSYGYSAGLVRSPDFGKLRLVRKGSRPRQRVTPVVTNVRVSNNRTRVISKSRSAIKARVKVK